LVELQRNLPDFERNNIAVLGISYDPVDVLARFAAAHGVNFPLLSDEGSKVIRELGMLDEQVYEHQAAFGVTNREERFWGVPYPGEFLLDERGVVTEKRFQKNYRVRETSQTILEQGFGVAASSHSPAVRIEAGGVVVRSFLAHVPHLRGRTRAQVLIFQGRLPQWGQKA
jgi:peroxiredoxin